MNCAISTFKTLKPPIFISQPTSARLRQSAFVHILCSVDGNCTRTVIKHRHDINSRDPLDRDISNLSENLRMLLPCESSEVRCQAFVYSTDFVMRRQSCLLHAGARSKVVGRGGGGFATRKFLFPMFGFIF